MAKNANEFELGGNEGCQRWKYHVPFQIAHFMVREMFVGQKRLWLN